MLLIVIIITTTFGKTNKFYIIASLISVRFLYSVVNDLFVLTSSRKFGWHNGGMDLQASPPLVLVSTADPSSLMLTVSLTSSRKFGWHKWTRTTDLALIRRAL